MLRCNSANHCTIPPARSNTVHYCVEILLGFTRSNYYCTFRQQTAPAAASANSPILTSSLEITKHAFSIILPSTDCSKIPAHSCSATAKAPFPPRRFWQRLEMLKNDEGRLLLNRVTFSYVQYWMASAQWKKKKRKEKGLRTAETLGVVLPCMWQGNTELCHD